MTQNFELFVKIHDHKYDITVLIQSLSMKFSEIYPIVQECVKYGRRKDINFNTHMFEVFENLSSFTEGSIFTKDDLDKFIVNKSLIRVTPKPLSLPTRPSLPIAITQQKRQILKESEDYLRKNVTQIESYRKIVLAINIGWNLKQLKDWKKVSDALNDKQPDNENCNLFFLWTKYYAKNYDKLNNKIESNPQKIFDLLKVVHTLDLNQIYSDNNETAEKIKDISNYPEFKQFFEKNLKEIRSQKLKINKMYVTRTPIKFSMNNNSTLRENPIKSPVVSPSTPSRSTGQTLNRSTDRSDRAVSNDRQSNQLITKRSNQTIDRSTERSDREVSSIRKSESGLKENEIKIKNYRRIVLAINIGWDFIDDKIADKNWDKVSQTIGQIHFTSSYCRNSFFFWSRFYAQNYDQLNGNLGPKYQQIFDCLKVVHTLNLDRLYSTRHKSDEFIKIEEISTKIELKEYFAKYLSSIRNKKEATEEKNSTNADRPNTGFHLMAYKALCLEHLRDDSPVNRGNSPRKSVSTLRSNRSYTSITDIRKRRENRSESFGHRNDTNVSRTSHFRFKNNSFKTFSQRSRPSGLRSEDRRLKRT